MAAEQVLKLLDSYWFEYGIFSSKPVLEIHEEVEKPKVFKVPTLYTRCYSDHCLSSKENCFSSDSLSPKSVLSTPKLQTIHSGKEVEGFSEPSSKQDYLEIPIKKSVMYRRRKTKKKGTSKSLSELEFEELKGFMDLGFVFSEEDKNSSLVSIVPGLQRLGQKYDDNNGSVDEEKEEEKSLKDYAILRPYLSEAWDVLELPVMNLRIPSSANEMEMKDLLRFWAHTVASTVM